MGAKDKASTDGKQSVEATEKPNGKIATAALVRILSPL
jgi:hypothetical protein